MTDKEIIIDGVDVSKCIHIDNYKHCNCCNDLIKTIYPKASKCLIEEDLRCEIYPNCYFKQRKRKEQECEELSERTASIIHSLTGGRLSYSTYTLEGCEDAYRDQLSIDVERATKELEEENEILKQECKNLEEELRGCRIGIKNISIESTEICKISEKYKRALDDIEQIAQTGLKPICYKSNCSRCKCYDGDNCKASVTEFLNYFFDDNGDMREDEDFGESLIALVDKERLKCNRAKPISEKILDIIHKTRAVNNE